MSRTCFESCEAREHLHVFDKKVRAPVWNNYRRHYRLAHELSGFAAGSKQVHKSRQVRLCSLKLWTFRTEHDLIQSSDAYLMHETVREWYLETTRGRGRLVKMFSRRWCPLWLVEGDQMTASDRLGPSPTSYRRHRSQCVSIQHFTACTAERNCGQLYWIVLV